jgi:phage repressor protein C with HTH and peptisase S24 domain
MAKELKRLSAKTLELKSLNPEHADLGYSREDVAWIARILWASQ